MVSVYENSQKSTRKREESIACFGKPILGVHPAIPPLILDLLPYMGISIIAGQSDAVTVYLTVYFCHGIAGSSTGAGCSDEFE